MNQTEWDRWSADVVEKHQRDKSRESYDEVIRSRILKVLDGKLKCSVCRAGELPAVKIGGRIEIKYWQQHAEITKDNKPGIGSMITVRLACKGCRHLGEVTIVPDVVIEEPFGEGKDFSYDTDKKNWTFDVRVFDEMLAKGTFKLWKEEEKNG